MLEETLVLFAISACCACVCGGVFVCMTRGDKVSFKKECVGYYSVHVYMIFPVNDLPTGFNKLFTKRSEIQIMVSELRVIFFGTHCQNE